MSEDEKITEEALSAEESAGDGDSSDIQIPAAELGAGSVEAKLELLVNISMLTIMTLMRVIKRKGPEAIGEEELKQFEKVRESVLTARDAVENWSQENEGEEAPIDLTRLRSKLDLLMKKIEAWPIEATTIDSTPPS